MKWSFWDQVNMFFGGPDPVEKVHQKIAEANAEAERMKHSVAKFGEPAIVVIDDGGVYVNGIFHKTPLGKCPIVGTDGIYGYSSPPETGETK